MVVRLKKNLSSVFEETLCAAFTFTISLPMSLHDSDSLDTDTILIANIIKQQYDSYCLLGVNVIAWVEQHNDGIVTI